MLYQIQTQQPNETYYMTIVRSGSLDLYQVGRFDTKYTPEQDWEVETLCVEKKISHLPTWQKA